MRQVSLCLVGLAAVLGASGYVAVGHSTSLVAAVQSPKGDLKIDRTLKGDRQMAIVVKGQAPGTVAPVAKAAPAAAPAVNVRLPDGCEPSVSPLAGKGLSSIRARCVS